MVESAALFALRVCLGAVFIAHGWRHYRNRAKVMAWTGSIGFRSPRLQWLLMAVGELGIGVGLITGFLTPVAAAGAVAITAVAYWTVHRRAGFFVTASPDEGREYVFVLAVAAVAVATLGPGEWSVDHRLDWSLSGGGGAAIAASGFAAAALQVALFFRAKP